MHNVICEYEIYRLGGNRMKKISLILFLCIIAFSILRAEDKAVIKLVPVYEKTFQDTIVDVVFDTATVNIEKAKAMGWKEEAFNEEERAKGEVTISYPKVVLVGKKGFPVKQKIKFLDRNGKVKKVVSGKGASMIIFSTNGKYILKTLWYDTEADKGGGALLFNNNGDILWEKSKGDFYAVTDNGYTATGFVSPTGASYPFIIYDPLGKKIKEVELPDWGIFDAGICSNGEYFIITYGGNAGFDSTGVMIIGKKGEIIFQRILPGDIIPQRVLSLPDTQFIVISMSGEKIEKEHQIIYIALNNNNWVIKQHITRDFLGVSLFARINSKLYIYSINHGYLIKLNIHPLLKISLIGKLPSGLKLYRGRFYQLQKNSLECFKL